MIVDPMLVDNLEGYKNLSTAFLTSCIYDRERALNNLHLAKMYLENSEMNTQAIEERIIELSTELAIIRGYLDERINPTTTDESMD